MKTQKTRCCIDWLTNMLWPEARRNWILNVPQGQRVLYWLIWSLPQLTTNSQEQLGCEIVGRAMEESKVGKQERESVFQKGVEKCVWGRGNGFACWDCSLDAGVAGEKWASAKEMSRRALWATPKVGPSGKPLEDFGKEGIRSKRVLMGFPWLHLWEQTEAGQGREEETS